MPRVLINKLKKEYANLPQKERQHAIYGTLNKIGAMRGSRETTKGKSIEKALENKKK